MSKNQHRRQQRAHLARRQKEMDHVAELTRQARDWRPRVWRASLDLEDDWYPCHYAQPVARQDHSCEHEHRDGPCGRPIPQGTRYVFLRGIAYRRQGRERFVNRKICGACVSVKVGGPAPRPGLAEDQRGRE